MSRFFRAIDYLRSHDLVLLAGCAVLFFLVYASFYNGNQGLYPSPDEQANAVFAQNFAKTGDLQIERTILVDAVRPRSVNIFGQSFVPGFFLGLVLLAGTVGKVMGMWAIPLVPAAVAAATPLAFYVTARRVFVQKTARASALLLFLLPPWAYYASRSFLPNVAMLGFYLVGWAFLLVADERWEGGRHRVAAALAMVAGLSFGLSFIIRPVEWVWALVVLLIVAWFSRSRLRFSLSLLVFLFFSIPVLWFGYWQQQTYGFWYMNGYASLNTALDSTQGVLGQGIFPFGFEVLPSLDRFFVQTFPLYWPLIIFVLLGFFAYLQRANKSTAQKLYASLFIGLSLYLIFYYGSWVIRDHPDPAWVSIGTAYHRYWLPIFVMALPYLAIGLNTVSVQLARRWAPARSLAWVAVLVFCAFSVFGRGDDSLGRLKQNSVKYEYLRAEVLAATLPASVIATERQDKLFWPDRQVITFADQDYVAVAGLASSIPVELYMLSALPASHIAVVEQRDFVPFQLSLIPVLSVDEMTLYRVDRF